MKQKNKRISRNKTNSINSNKVENNMGNDGKKGSNTKSSCDFKKLLCIGRRLKKKFMERKNMYEEKKEEKDFMHKVLKNLLRLHPLILSGISVVGMICYFAYFGFELKYFPDLGGSDVAYVGVLLFFILTIISLFIILPCLVYPGYYENKKNKTWMFYFGLSLLPFLALVCMAILNTITISKSLYELLPYSLIVLGFYLVFVFYTEHTEHKTATFFKCIKNIVTFIALSVIIVYLLAINNVSFFNILLGDKLSFSFLIAVVHIITLGFF
jgi:putative membrane protein